MTVDQWGKATPWEVLGNRKVSFSAIPLDWLTLLGHLPVFL